MYIIEMADWYSIIYKACIYASIVAFLIGFFTSSKVSFGAYIAGYSVLTIGILLLLMLLFVDTLKHSPQAGILSLVVLSGPFWLMLGIVGLMLYCLVRYQSSLVQGHVAPSFYSFSNITVLLLLLQLGIVLSSVQGGRLLLSRLNATVMYLLGVLSAISSITLFNILKYFSTDGFTTFK